MPVKSLYVLSSYGVKIHVLTFDKLLESIFDIYWWFWKCLPAHKVVEKLDFKNGHQLGRGKVTMVCVANVWSPVCSTFEALIVQCGVKHFFDQCQPQALGFCVPHFLCTLLGCSGLSGFRKLCWSRPSGDQQAWLQLVCGAGLFLRSALEPLVQWLSWDHMWQSDKEQACHIGQCHIGRSKWWVWIFSEFTGWFLLQICWMVGVEFLAASRVVVRGLVWWLLSFSCCQLLMAATVLLIWSPLQNVLHHYCMYIWWLFLSQIRYWCLWPILNLNRRIIFILNKISLKISREGCILLWQISMMQKPQSWTSHNLMPSHLSVVAVISWAVGLLFRKYMKIWWFFLFFSSACSKFRVGPRLWSLVPLWIGFVSIFSH